MLCDFFVSDSRTGMLYLVTLLSQFRKHQLSIILLHSKHPFQHSNSSRFKSCKTALHIRFRCWSSPSLSRSLSIFLLLYFLSGTQLVLHHIACTCLYAQFMASNVNQYAQTLFCTKIDLVSIDAASPVQ